MKMSFTGAMKLYFGLKSGQTISQFAAELRELTPEVKLEFWAMLIEQAGIPCDPPAEPK